MPIYSVTIFFIMLILRIDDIAFAVNERDLSISGTDVGLFITVELGPDFDTYPKAILREHVNAPQPDGIEGLNTVQVTIEDYTFAKQFGAQMILHNEEGDASLQLGLMWIKEDMEEFIGRRGD